MRRENKTFSFSLLMEDCVVCAIIVHVLRAHIDFASSSSSSSCCRVVWAFSCFSPIRKTAAAQSWGKKLLPFISWRVFFNRFGCEKWKVLALWQIEGKNLDKNLFFWRKVCLPPSRYKFGGFLRLNFSVLTLSTDHWKSHKRIETQFTFWWLEIMTSNCHFTIIFIGLCLCRLSTQSAPHYSLQVSKLMMTSSKQWVKFWKNKSAQEKENRVVQSDVEEQWQRSLLVAGERDDAKKKTM